MPDYIPSSDAAFDLWQQNFVTVVTNKQSELGVAAEDVTELAGLQLIWDASYMTHGAAQTQARGARQTKDGDREVLEAACRRLTRQLQATPGVTDEHRATLGINIPDRSRTRVPVPVTRPSVVLAHSTRLQHVLRYFDEASPETQARPPGFLGAELWVATTPLGEGPPPDPGLYALVRLSRSSPAVVNIDPADGTLVAHYMLRWVNTHEEHGPWSDVLSVTVMA